MPRRQRDYRAEYEARKRRAAAQGLSTAQARGHARARKGELPITELRRRGQLPAPRRRAPRRRKVIPLGGGRVVRPEASYRTQRTELKRAAAAGRKAAALVTVRDATGGGRRAFNFATRWLDGSHYSYTLEGAFVSAQLVISDEGLDPSFFLDELGEEPGDQGAGWDLVLDAARTEGMF